MKIPPLEKFKEDIRYGRNHKRLGHGCRAYRMDGEPGMRERAGLTSALSCCDYLHMDHRVILIEETELAETILRLAKETCCTSLDDKEERREFAWNYMCEWVAGENCNKVRGAFLTLLCMRVQLDDVRHEFWIVDSSNRPGAMRAIRGWNRNKELESEIQARLDRVRGRGRGWVNLVEVITPEELHKRLTGKSSPRRN